MGPRIRRLAAVLGIAVGLWFGLGALTVFVATRPSEHWIPPRDHLGEKTVVEVEVRSIDEVRSSAWFIDAGRERCVILLSGIHGSRLASLPRAEFWLDRGWSMLLPDLRGTGESDSRSISFGWNERLDVEAWILWLRARGVKTIALHGQSLGAAAAVYAAADGSTIELLVLDACYDDVEHALERRLPFVPWPALTLFPVRLFAELRIGASANELRPVECLKRIRTPLFMAVGTDDREVGRSAPAEMLAASASEHKQLHWVEGARHEELWLRKSPALPRALAAFIESAKIE